MPDIARPAGPRPVASILVTGATGNLGREVVARLQARDAHVRRFVRPAADFDQDPNIETATGDLTDRVTVRAALAGVETLVLIWPLLEAAPARVVMEELAETAPRIVYVSSTAIDDDAPRQSDPIVQTHKDMETMLADAGLRPRVLRSDTLASNVRGWTAQLRAGDIVTGPDIARTAVVDERDVADAIVAAALTNPTQLDRGPYLLTGPELLSRADLVETLGSALRRRLHFDAVPVDLARTRMLTDGRPAALVEALISASRYRPESTLVTDHVERLTGRPATTFARWALDHVADFR
ncbi:NAD(P)H-binding protein [Dactylosporangium sp. NPDC051484]|uniref:NAD(P)H-binding protein n=1 Tax=Dactylosporangium sp. NPDC051484 TaxID=3154942 RepID=UPI0034501DA3